MNWGVLLIIDFYLLQKEVHAAGGGVPADHFWRGTSRNSTRRGVRKRIILIQFHQAAGTYFRRKNNYDLVR